MPASTTLARAVTLALVALPGAAMAGKLDYTLYTGIEHSNNISLSTNNPISENVLIPGVDFTYLQQGSTIQANVAGTLEYHDYLNGHFDNQTQTQIAAQANWTVLPQRLDFSVEDYAGVQPVDSLASNSPDNQQQTNVLALGPTLHMHFSDAMSGQVDLRYINSYASKVDEFNSSRGVAAGRLIRDLNPTDQLSLNVETQRVVFDQDAGGSDYVRNEAYVRYTSRLAKIDIDALVGGSQLNFDHAPTDSSPLARVSIGWRPTVRSTFSLDGAYQYADAAQDMMQAPGQSLPSDLEAGNPGPVGVGNAGSGIGSGNAAINSEVYLEKSLGASYAYANERLTITISPLFRKLHYLNDPTFDQTGRGGGISVGYRLQPTLTLTAFADGERLTYQSLDRRDKTIRFGLDLSRQWTSHWSWHASVSRQRRDSNATEQSYRETQVFFSVVYRR
jgi:hypothetical protein